TRSKRDWSSDVCSSDLLGPRPIDQHIKGFEAFGAKVTNEQGAMYLIAEELTGAKIFMDVVSVGATINIMLAACLAKGKTVIENEIGRASCRGRVEICEM